MDLNKAKGVIFGLAIGDALGARTEFMKPDQIRAKYGVDGIRDLPDPALFTDDRNRIILTLAGIAAAFMLVLLVYVPAMAAQKYMESAISKLEDAKSDLDKASRDKGGHRAKAVKLIDEAISEVRKGIEYDRTHVSPEEGERKHSNKVDLDDLRDMKAQESGFGDERSRF